jgi:hypothetical protein
MDELLIFAAWLVVELLLIGTGRAVISLASFGRWRGERDWPSTSLWPSV